MLTCLVNHFVQTRVFTLGDLEERMMGFPYKGTHKVNKPRPLANQLAQLKMRQQASQIRYLLHLFPLLIGDRIEEGNPKWEVLLVLSDVVDTVTAPVLSRSEALFLYDLVEQFHSLFANEFPDFPFKPKAHFLLHYPHQILEFGPLMACWALRFEGKHSFFKEIATRLKSRKNVCKKLAYRHQYHQALCHTSPSFLADEAVSHTANSNKVQVRLLLEGIQRVLSPLIGGEEEVCQCSSVQVNGTVYGEGCAVVVGYDCDLHQFAKMESCFMIGGSPYLLCKRQQTMDFNRHFHCYVIEEVSAHCLFVKGHVNSWIIIPFRFISWVTKIPLYFTTKYLMTSKLICTKVLCMYRSVNSMFSIFLDQIKILNKCIIQFQLTELRQQSASMSRMVKERRLLKWKPR